MKKINLSNLILLLIFFAGLSLMLYPTVSDYVNSRSQTRAISNYSAQVAQIDNTVYDSLIREAREYNTTLLTKENPYRMSEEEMKVYESLLDVSDLGIMGYIEIPRLKEKLAIYHGTSDDVLQVAIGHVDWTSLPVGGRSTHSVLSGHRGLPSAKLFTDLDQLEEGDTFILYILDETMTYEVDQIRIVEPQEVKDLVIQEGKDLCTLVTCTPYGINTHRLLVRGHRVENQAVVQNLRITADAMQIETHLVAIAVAIPMLLLLLIYLLVTTRRRK